MMQLIRTVLVVVVVVVNGLRLLATYFRCRAPSASVCFDEEGRGFVSWVTDDGRTNETVTSSVSPYHKTLNACMQARCVVSFRTE